MSRTKRKPPPWRHPFIPGLSSRRASMQDSIQWTALYAVFAARIEHNKNRNRTGRGSKNAAGPCSTGCGSTQAPLPHPKRENTQNRSNQGRKCSPRGAKEERSARTHAGSAVPCRAVSLASPDSLRKMEEKRCKRISNLEGLIFRETGVHGPG